MTQIKPIGCKDGSAWHSWQQRGARWAELHYGYSESDLLAAAESFASQTGYPQAAKYSLRTAFTEGVRANTAA